MTEVFNGQSAGDPIATDRIPPYIYPRDAAGAIHIGSRYAKPWEPVMLYNQAHAELVAIFAMFDKLAAFLGNASHLDGEAWRLEATALSREILALQPGHAGGEPSAGLKGCPAGHVGG